MPLANGATFAGFTILRLLGSGGMGEVYLARHPRLSRSEALKILPRSLAEKPDYRLRFEREADAAAALWHPHIVGVHDRGEYDGLLWISMDYVEGSDAKQLLRERFASGLPRPDAVTIVSAVGDALDYAHSQGVLHRDVKSANILLTDTRSGWQRVLLADFGIARRIDEISGLTATNMTVGTLNYTAPEQLLEGPIDGRADQYALAATAFHLLTGAVPHAHSNPAAVINQRLNGSIPRLADTRPDLADLDAVMARGLARDPDDRFASCQDFAAALRGTQGATPSRAVIDAAAGTLPAAALTPATSPAPTPASGEPAVHKSVPQPLIWTLAGLGVLMAVVVVVVVSLLAFGEHRPASRAAVSASSTSVRPSWAVPPVPATPSTSTHPPVVPTTARMVLPDADEYGFLSYNGGARCAEGDRAATLLRTAQSAVVICRNASRGLYYRGYRISDGATLELDNVVPDGAGFVARNLDEDARYEVSSRGLKIVQHGEVLANESAIESAS